MPTEKQKKSTETVLNDLIQTMNQWDESFSCGFIGGSPFLFSCAIGKFPHDGDELIAFIKGYSQGLFEYMNQMKEISGIAPTLIVDFRHSKSLNYINMYYRITQDKEFMSWMSTQVRIGMGVRKTIAKPIYIINNNRLLNISMFLGIQLMGIGDRMMPSNIPIKIYTHLFNNLVDEYSDYLEPQSLDEIKDLEDSQLIDNLLVQIGNLPKFAEYIEDESLLEEFPKVGKDELIASLEKDACLLPI